MWAFDTHEHPRLLEHTEVLRSWGFTYTVPRWQRCQTPLMERGREHSNAGENYHCPPLATAGPVLVQMHTVPRVAGVTLAQVHLRKMLSQLNTDALTGSDSDHFSQCASSLRFRPTAVSEILAYRACHSAVRFGDQLTHHECCRIILQLARCRVPFQCAHGRPTLHPIMVL
jgi:DNA mismatch repair ATPase MutL